MSKEAEQSKATRVGLNLTDEQWARLDEMAVRAAGRLAPIFKALDWKWGEWGGDLRVPNDKEIATTIRRLIDMAVQSEEEEGMVSSGRITVAYSTDDGLTGFDISIGAIDEVEWPAIEGPAPDLSTPPPPEEAG